MMVHDGHNWSLASVDSNGGFAKWLLRRVSPRQPGAKCAPTEDGRAKVNGKDG